MTPTAFRRILPVLTLVCVALVSALAAQTGTRTAAAPGAPAAIPYTTGTWDANALGNHRVVLEVDAPADAVRARIPWRRRDPNPEKKNLLVFDAQSGARVTNVVRERITREDGALVFQPTSGKGRYFVYYLPNVGSGRSNYPKVVYPEPENTAAPEWLSKHGLPEAAAALGQKSRALPLARVVEFQAIDDLNSFFPMEVIATASETKLLLARNWTVSYLRVSGRSPVPDQDDRRPAAAMDRGRRQRAVQGRGRPRRVLRLPGRPVRGAEADRRTGRPLRRSPHGWRSGHPGHRLPLLQYGREGLDRAGVQEDGVRRPGQGPGAVARRAGARTGRRRGLRGRDHDCAGRPAADRDRRHAHGFRADDSRRRATTIPGVIRGSGGSIRRWRSTTRSSPPTRRSRCATTRSACSAGPSSSAATDCRSTSRAASRRR